MMFKVGFIAKPYIATTRRLASGALLDIPLCVGERGMTGERLDNPVRGKASAGQRVSFRFPITTQPAT